MEIKEFIFVKPSTTIHRFLIDDNDDGKKKTNHVLYMYDMIYNNVYGDACNEYLMKAFWKSLYVFMHFQTAMVILLKVSMEVMTHKKLQLVRNFN